MAFVYRCGLFLMLCLYFMGDLTLAKKCRKTCKNKNKPKCGSNGVTYRNRCHFKMAKCKIPGLKISHGGECKIGVCPPLEGPGLCMELCEETEDCKAGELCCFIGCGHVCMEAIFPKCPESCTEQYEPVCGSDNKTYDNRCYFNNAKCKDPSLTIVDEGACKECPESCTEQYEPVCGSDNKTYDNRCYFNNAKCKDPSLTIVHEGACKVCPPIEGAGICVELCEETEDCKAGELCCSNGCGHVCMEAIFPTNCPKPPQFITCDSGIVRCTKKKDCGEKICCESNCGLVCL